MSSPLAIVSPVAFYNSLEEQNHRKPYIYGVVTPVVHPKGQMLPFQFITANSDTVIVSVKRYDCSDNLIDDITSAISPFMSFTAGNGSTTSIVYNPTTFPVFPDHEGSYYLVMHTDKGTYYSDVLLEKKTMQGYLKIEASNSATLSTNWGDILWPTGYVFRFYAASTLGRPEYVFDEETTDHFGYTFVESQSSKKQYVFNFLVPEFVCDSLRIVRMCDTVNIITDMATMESAHFKFDVEWTDFGNLANVKVTFDTDNIIWN